MSITAVCVLFLFSDTFATVGEFWHLLQSFIPNRFSQHDRTVPNRIIQHVLKLPFRSLSISHTCILDIMQISVLNPSPGSLFFFNVSEVVWSPRKNKIVVK